MATMLDLQKPTEHMPKYLYTPTDIPGTKWPSSYILRSVCMNVVHVNNVAVHRMSIQVQWG